MFHDIVRKWITKRLNLAHQNTPGLRSPFVKALATARMDRLLRDSVSNTRVPGIAAALFANGTSVSAAAGIRNVDQGSTLQPSTPFELAEIVRPLVAGVAHELVRVGKLDAEAPITSYLTGLDEIRFLNDIAVANLMSHTSGYMGPNPHDLDLRFQYSWSDFERFLRSTSTLFTPGTVFNKLDTEVVILGQIIERLTACNVLSIANEVFEDSIGVDSTSAEDCISGHVFSATEGKMCVVDGIQPCDFWRGSCPAALPISVEQLAKLGQALFMHRTETTSKSNHLAGSRSGMTRRFIQLPEQLYGPGSPEVPSYGCLGCDEYACGVFGVSSADRGQCVGIRAIPNARIALAVGINAQLPGLLDAVMRQILSDFCGVSQRSQASTLEIDVDVRDLQGWYQAAHSHTLRVVINDGHVEFEDGHNTWLPRESATLTGSALRIVSPNTVRIARGCFGRSIGLFRDRATGVPCISVGASTFKKIA